MRRILIVDDDTQLLDIVAFTLEKQGHEVHRAENGKQALASWRSHGPFDCLVLDVLMPEMDGLDVCRHIRADSHVPILFLSSKGDELDKVLGLEMGGDDYLTKPFSPRELAARVKALLRRSGMTQAPAETPEIRHGRLLIDPLRHQVQVAGQVVALTVTEFSILRTLAKRPGQVFTRKQLIALAYEDLTVITERTTDSHIKRLRRKFRNVGYDPIETVYGLGYRLKEEAS